MARTIERGTEFWQSAASAAPGCLRASAGQCLIAILLCSTDALAQRDWIPDEPADPLLEWPAQPHCAASPAPRWITPLFVTLKARMAPHATLRVCTGNQSAQSFPDGVVEIGAAVAKLPYCQLAFVLGHELAHVRLGHADQEVRLIASLARLPYASVSDVQAAIAFDLNLSLKLSDHFIGEEVEADWVGQLLAAEVGCPPEEAGEAWLIGQPDESPVISTHPARGLRMERLISWRGPARVLMERFRTSPAYRIRIGRPFS